MKRVNLKKVVGIVSVVALLMSVGILSIALAEKPVQKQEKAKGKEQYVQKVIIDAKWGKGPGEFGLMEEEGRWGPESLAIDNQGNIYMLDSINKRIQKFNKEGKYMASINLDPHIRFRCPDDLCIDQVGNLYVLRKGFPGGIVRQYTQKGELVREYPISNEIGQVWNINVDESGNLFVEGLEGYVRTKKGAFRKVYQLGTKDKAHDPTQQLKNAKRGIPCEGGEYRYEIGKREVGKRKYLSLIKILDRKGKLKREIVVKRPAFWSIPTTFLGVDQTGHIYIEVQTFIGSFKKEDLGFEVHKYDKRGNLLAKIEMPYAYITARAPYRPIAIDKFGNVYQLQLLEAGVSVIKWKK